MAPRLPRQAVLLVHGIGEQGPLTTLRSFTRGERRQTAPEQDIDRPEGIVSPDHALFLSPDVISRRSYSRRFRVTWNHHGYRSPPGEDVADVLAQHNTDFLELYWAPHFRDTRITDLVKWGAGLLRRSRRSLLTTRMAGTTSPGNSARPTLFVTVALWCVATAWTCLLWKIHYDGASSGRPGSIANAGTFVAIAAIAALCTAGAIFGLLWNLKLMYLVVAIVAGWTITAALFADTRWSSTPPINDGWWWALCATGVTALAIWVFIASSRSGPLSTARWMLSSMLVVGAAWEIAAQASDAHVPHVLAGAAGTAFTAAAGAAALRFGDVPRYLVRSPRNVTESEQLLEDAVETLRRLHAEKNEHGSYVYERIVVVGHSLGSVIAQDALRVYWSRVNLSMRFRNNAASGSARLMQQTARLAALQELEETATALAVQAYGKVENDVKPGMQWNERQNSDTFKSYRAAQGRLGDLLTYPFDATTPTCEDAQYPNRWVVSDFVTLGSPLAHAELLLAKGFDYLLRDQEERSLATCPPQFQRSETDGEATRLSVSVPSKDGSYLHQAALYGPCRWTNIYFGRDTIGGPIAPVFGPGIRDIAVNRGSGTTLDLIAAGVHAAYWKLPRDERERIGFETSKKVLRAVIEREARLRIWTDDPDSAAAVAKKVLSLPQVDTTDETSLEVEVYHRCEVGTKVSRTSLVLRHRMAKDANADFVNVAKLVADIRDAVPSNGLNFRLVRSHDIRPFTLRQSISAEDPTYRRPSQPDQPDEEEDTE